MSAKSCLFLLALLLNWTPASMASTIASLLYAAGMPRTCPTNLVETAQMMPLLGAAQALNTACPGTVPTKEMLQAILPASLGSLANIETPLRACGIIIAQHYNIDTKTVTDVVEGSCTSTPGVMYCLKYPIDAAVEQLKNTSAPTQPLSASFLISNTNPAAIATALGAATPYLLPVGIVGTSGVAAYLVASRPHNEELLKKLARYFNPPSAVAQLTAHTQEIPSNEHTVSALIDLGDSQKDLIDNKLKLYKDRVAISAQIITFAALFMLGYFTVGGNSVSPTVSPVTPTT